jgi:hypothetical protein
MYQHDRSGTDDRSGVAVADRDCSFSIYVAAATWSDVFARKPASN